MKGYSKKIEEYVKVRLETISNNTQIAREVKRTFDIPQELDRVRRWISDVRKKTGIDKSKMPIKRLFFDIETSYITFRGWRTGKQWVSHDNVIQDKKIICICYKWEYEDDVRILQWDDKQNDKKIVKEFIKVLGEADEIIGHNGDRFDIKEVRTRAIKLGLLMFPKYRTLDTLKKARKYFNFHSNKLDYIGQFLHVGRKLPHEGFQLWIDIVEGKKKSSLKKMIDYCIQDVILLEDAFTAMNPYIDHNTNFAVQKGEPKWKCPNCASGKVSLCHTDTTPMGYIKRHMKCKSCKKQYHIANNVFLDYLKKDLI